jgi:DnaJ-class molecular chaperone
VPRGASDIDYYEVLGVDPAASDDDLRRAWKQLALKWHPDRAGSAGTEFIFQRIADAYAVLCDPEARAAYDRKRPRRSSQGSARSSDPAPPAPRAPGVLLMNLSRPLDALFALGIARVLPDGVIELAVDDADASEGGMIRISMRVDIHCDACNAGVDSSCTRCGGARVLDETYSAWLALRPGVADGTVLRPSAQLPGVVREVTFRVRRT